jgi:hypothetical protein
MATSGFPDRGRFHTLLPCSRKVLKVVSAIPKLFELLVYRAMYNNLKNLYNVFNQHGFMKNQPIGVCIFRAEFNWGRQSGWFHLYGLFKGFCVCVIKCGWMRCLSVLGPLDAVDACSWQLRFYLSGSIQKIRIGDAVSKDIKVTLGVPQGSHLGPVCFIWFVNRILEILDYFRVLFDADDMKLFLPVSGFQFENSVGSVQHEWCERSSLLLNVG